MSTRPADYHRHLYPDIHNSILELKRGNPAHVEPIITFLERDPYTHRSGYDKEKAWRYLGRVPLTDKQKERLRQVALHYARTRLSREFFPMCRFMSGLATEKFKRQVQELEASPEGRVRWRAALLSAYLEGLHWGEEVRQKSRWQRTRFR